MMSFRVAAQRGAVCGGGPSSRRLRIGAVALRNQRFDVIVNLFIGPKIKGPGARSFHGFWKFAGFDEAPEMGRRIRYAPFGLQVSVSKQSHNNLLARCDMRGEKTQKLFLVMLELSGGKKHRYSLIPIFSIFSRNSRPAWRVKSCSNS